MFIFVLFVVLLAAAIHAARIKDRSIPGMARIVLIYLLVGYCGLPMLPLSVWNLMSPDQAAAMFGFPAGSPFQTFFGFAYLGMSLLSILALWYRGSYLIGPALMWSVFFAGATYIHWKDLGEKGVLTHGSMIEVFLTHGLISVLVAGALLASGLWKQRA